ncbi:MULTISPECIES: hypothetical protein [Pseudomonas]|jgi:hypothetical protein|uniref:hypothetical protein n=1 Tax=Pseudomonas citronellolis TaxID=53408 RepID=UPI000853616C|nr:MULTISPECIES: hypothetical protein [Pseudomonas]
MKAKLLLTPLAIATVGALAVTSAASAIAAEPQNSFLPPPIIILPPPPPPPTGSANAVVNDTQTNGGNYVYNQGTENTANADGSIKFSSGNVGANVAAGDNNQQANAAALATADEHFVFGSANATTNVTQTGTWNKVDNYSTQNTASLNGSVNGISGNIGANVAAGNFNQQKNDLAAAVSAGQNTYATSNANQTSGGNVTLNNAVQKTTYAPIVLGVGLGGGYVGGGVGGYAGAGVGGYAGGSVGSYQGTVGSWWSSESEHGTTHSVEGGGLGFVEGGGLGFVEAGNIALGGVAVGAIPIVSGYYKVVQNDANLNGSIIGVSGNVGVNVAAGTGNQQSNSLSIAAGCQACAAKNSW